MGTWEVAASWASILEEVIELQFYLVFTIFSDQPPAQNSAQSADEQNVPDSIDPSTFTDTSPTSQMFDSPPTAADQESPSASISKEMSKETGATMNVNDYL